MGNTASTQSSTISAAAVMASRLDELYKNRVLETSLRSIETNVVNPSDCSIETKQTKRTQRIPDQGDIPDSVDQLIDNKMYRNKYKKLIREGHLQDLVELAQVARERSTETSPSRYFARATRTTPIKGEEGALTRWERALKFLANLRNVRNQAQAVASRLGIQVTGFILKQVWSGKLVDRWAAVAQESGRNKERYFAWLCNNQDELLAQQRT